MVSILIIDDDVAILARLETILTEAGYTVTKMNEVPSAEALLNEQPPHIVLLEVKTSRGAGWQLLKHYAAYIPIIVLSAEGREEDVVRGLEMGAIDYIAKPYRTNEMVARIRVRLNGVSQPQKIPVPAHQVAESAPEDAFAVQSMEHMEQDDADEPASPPVLERALPVPPDSDRAVFIAENEELSLIRSENNVEPESQDVLPTEVSLGQSLRAERQRRRMTLVEAENKLHIRMWYLQAMEEEKFTLLPQGAMAAQMLRTYAAHLGMNVNQVMEQYQQLYAAHHVAPPPVFGDERLRIVPQWAVWVAAVLLALVVSGAGIVMLDPSGVNALGEQFYGLITTPTATVTATPTITPSATATLTPTNTPTPTLTPTVTPTPTLPPTPTVDSGNR